ncbi:uncharacterized protein PGTG_22556 [Puccinia graminis f. sp. tritici CRL 75-36-700-3]|uniref:Uncharacterized protein n=1 Tax=Puccinia graminis f. sp. tritici (strain CRL 75-36-700-3 / race SCCL) TaxID=418459 RepID=H6QUZ0_PUCGT|nr:uncharacterized protein PGTG_22556 [Puccinia graminis f. sp. tritici CRL 75-36-700-3]EHS62603.1 hypothetical protein PGTG_22556 [Puccinia graminis f. sp. tritici CRL 75-36-700-3]
MKPHTSEVSDQAEGPRIEATDFHDRTQPKSGPYTSNLYYRPTNPNKLAITNTSPDTLRGVVLTRDIFCQIYRSARPVLPSDYPHHSAHSILGVVLTRDVFCQIYRSARPVLPSDYPHHSAHSILGVVLNRGVICQIYCCTAK